MLTSALILAAIINVANDGIVLYPTNRCADVSEGGQVLGGGPTNEAVAIVGPHTHNSVVGSYAGYLERFAAATLTGTGQEPTNAVTTLSPYTDGDGGLVTTNHVSRLLRDGSLAEAMSVTNRDMRGRGPRWYATPDRMLNLGWRRTGFLREVSGMPIAIGTNETSEVIEAGETNSGNRVSQPWRNCNDDLAFGSFLLDDDSFELPNEVDWTPRLDGLLPSNRTWGDFQRGIDAWRNLGRYGQPAFGYAFRDVATRGANSTNFEAVAEQIESKRSGVGIGWLGAVQDVTEIDPEFLDDGYWGRFWSGKSWTRRLAWRHWGVINGMLAAIDRVHFGPESGPLVRYLVRSQSAQRHSAFTGRVTGIEAVPGEPGKFNLSDCVVEIPESGMEIGTNEVSAAATSVSDMIRFDASRSSGCSAVAELSELFTVRFTEDNFPNIVQLIHDYAEPPGRNQFLVKIERRTDGFLVRAENFYGTETAEDIVLLPEFRVEEIPVAGRADSYANLYKTEAVRDYDRVGYATNSALSRPATYPHPAAVAAATEDWETPLDYAIWQTRWSTTNLETEVESEYRTIIHGDGSIRTAEDVDDGAKSAAKDLLDSVGDRFETDMGAGGSTIGAMMDGGGMGDKALIARAADALQRKLRGRGNVMITPEPYGSIRSCRAGDDGPEFLDNYGDHVEFAILFSFVESESAAAELVGVTSGEWTAAQTVTGTVRWPWPSMRTVGE